jgi:hypothetical protein
VPAAELPLVTELAVVSYPKYSSSGTREIVASWSAVVEGVVVVTVVVTVVTGGTTTEIGGGSRLISSKVIIVFDVTGAGRVTLSVAELLFSAPASQEVNITKKRREAEKHLHKKAFFISSPP